MKKLLTLVVLLGMLLSLQVSFVVAQGEDPTPEITETFTATITSTETIAVTSTITITPTTVVTVTPVTTITPTTIVTATPGGEPTAEPPAEATEESAAEPPEAPPAARDEPSSGGESSSGGVGTAGDAGAQGAFNPGTGVSKIAVMNIDPSGPASYSVSFYSQTGTSDDTSTLSSEGPLAYRAAAYYDLSSLSLMFGSGWVGSVVVASDREMFAAVDNTYSGGTYTGGDGFNGEAYEAPEPATDIFLPYATQLGTYRFSRVTIQGTKDSGTTTVNFTYRDQNGNDATCSNPTSTTIEGSRSYTFEPQFNCGSNTDNGSIRITSGADPIVVVFDGSWGQLAGWKTAYSGIPASKASNTLYYPNVFRREPDDDWVQWSNLFVQNVSTSQVRVRVSLYNTGASSPSMQFEADIPPLSAKEFNTRFGGTGGYPSPGAFGALGNLFAGTAIVDKISGPDNALVGVAHNFWGTYFLGGSTYTAFSASDGGETLYVPFSARKNAGGTWTQWDKISFMNISGSSVQVDVKYYDGSGNVALDLTGVVGQITVPDLSVDSINTRYGCDSGACSASHLASLGDSFEGTIVISGPSGSRLVGIMNTLYPSRLNTFNVKAK